MVTIMEELSNYSVEELEKLIELKKLENLNLRIENLEKYKKLRELLSEEE